MEATPTPAPVFPGRPRKRPHPAKQARKTAAAVSVGAFLALTGAFAVKTTVTGTASTGTTTGPAATTVGASTDDGGTVTTGSDDPSTEDWAGTSATPDTNSNNSSPTYTPPATTQSHGS